MDSCCDFSSLVVLDELEEFESSFVITVTDAPEKSAALKTKRMKAGRTEMYCDLV